MKETAIVGWTRRGRLENLEATAANVLKQAGLKAMPRRVDGALLVSGSEPASIASTLQHLPGTSWIAVGGEASSWSEIRKVAGDLARRYLKPRRSFAVLGDAPGGSLPPSDLSGGVTSAVLDAVRGVRVKESSPDVTFRAAHDGAKGAVGVQLREGPGGFPMGGDWATCMVSGGLHSSVVAWEALLAGYRVDLVHVVVDADSVSAVAKLYAELSHRVDASGLSLRLLEGGGVARSIGDWAKKASGPVFGGFHGSRAKTPGVPLRVAAPLYLLSEESYITSFSGLGLLGYNIEQDWKRPSTGKFTVKTFGGVRADTTRVIDGLR